jgi:acyl-CoA thioesterase FadM
MKILLAIIAAASLVVGCGVIEEEQTTTDSGVGATTSAPTTPTESTTDSGVGATTSAPTTPTESTEPTPTTDNWAGTVQFGTSSYDFGRDIATDSDGNIYVTGYTGGDFSSYINAGDEDIFVAKYSSSGTQQWTQQLGTSSTDYGFGITTDFSGNVYVTGSTTGDFSSYINAGDMDIFVAKYNSSGTQQWTQQLGTSSADYGFGITTDSSGNVYVTGSTRGGLDGNTFAGSEDLFVVKYDSSGVKQWTQQLGSSNFDYGHDIATDSSGNVYVTGSTWGGLDGNTNAGSEDLFVVKYDSSGVKQWTQQLGTSEEDIAFGITSDSSGNVYVTGSTTGGLDGNSTAGGWDLFVVNYDSSGVKQWTQQLGTSEGDIAIGITSDPSGNIYMTGYTGGSLDGNTNAGSEDLFVVKYNSGGIKQWTQQLGTSEKDIAIRITSDPSDNVYVTGYTGGSLDGNTNAGSEDLFIVKYDTDGNKN